MCSKLKYKHGSFQGIINGSTEAGSLDAFFDDKYANARSETLNTTWSGYKQFKPKDRIESFIENNREFEVPKGLILYIATIISPYVPNIAIIKVVTRDAGRIFAEKNGYWPPLTPTHQLDIEDKIHHRFPIFVPENQWIVNPLDWMRDYYQMYGERSVENHL